MTKDFNSKNAIKEIKSFDSVDEIKAFISEDEDRTSVLGAAERRIAELTAPTEADPIKEPIVEAASTEPPAKKYKDSDFVEFVGNGTHNKLPARKPRKMQYATAKVLVAKGYGRVRED